MTPQEELHRMDVAADVVRLRSLRKRFRDSQVNDIIEEAIGRLGTWHRENCRVKATPFGSYPA